LGGNRIEYNTPIELFTVFAARNNQPEVSWEVITFLADNAFAGMTLGQRLTLTGSEDLVFALITYSEDGDYRYQSETDHATFGRIANRTMSYDEWVAAANAGFR